MATSFLVPERAVEASTSAVLGTDAVVVFSDLEMQMLDAHDAIRAEGGIVLLEADAALTEVARQRATDMAANGYFAHVSPAGETAFTLLGALNYRYSLASENLARNNFDQSESVAVAMNGFMNSAGHRANILDARLRYVGIGSATGADGMIYYAVVFAAR